MRILQINDLSFCEIVSNSQVQGGLSINYLFGSLANYLPESLSKSLEPKLQKLNPQTISSENGYVVEEFNSDSGNVFGYQATSEDGKSQITTVTGKEGNLSFTSTFARSST